MSCVYSSESAPIFGQGGQIVCAGVPFITWEKRQEQVNNSQIYGPFEMFNLLDRYPYNKPEPEYKSMTSLIDRPL